MTKQHDHDENHEQKHVAPKKARTALQQLAPHAVLLVVMFISLLLVMTCFYTVQPEEVGVVKRFGRYIATTGPGFHFKLPFNIDTLTKVKIQRIYKEEFGFRTRRSGIRSEFEPGVVMEEALMLTGDLNSAIVEWIVQYKIKDPVQYLFNIRNPKKTIRDLSESMMREVVGDRSVDEVFTVGRMEIENDVQVKLQEIFNHYQMGVEIITVKLQDVTPPEPVKPSFNDVNEAKQDKERLINEAWKDYNTVIPKCEGEKKKTIQEAEGFATERINRAKGDAARFIKLYNEYRKAPQVTRKRLYLEEMEKILKNAGKVYIIDKEARSVIPLFPAEPYQKEVK
ncbi:MAG: FtsH protease activity modulator HflK [Candidatus Eremiobacteraeota bacterium]|nr:FtsH protease activity modulator HflK [Candidatus Eremiobacteraeota bacterium]